MKNEHRDAETQSTDGMDQSCSSSKVTTALCGSAPLHSIPPLFLSLLLVVQMGCQPQARVTHVVVCWLKTPGDASARQQLIVDSKSFTRIPGIVAVSAGAVLPTTRPSVDSSFDVAIVMKFRDEAALASYGQHPVHLAAVERTLKPLVAKYVIYDYVEGR